MDNQTLNELIIQTLKSAEGPANSIMGFVEALIDVKGIPAETMVIALLRATVTLGKCQEDKGGTLTPLMPMEAMRDLMEVCYKLERTQPVPQKISNPGMRVEPDPKGH
tara:strand:+ start:2221 stop:2544 length:324 start_codon:yes stop_codon:yes gene_type:complete